MKQNQDEIQVSPLQLLKAVMKRAWLVCLCALICAGIVFTANRLTDKPQYSSSVLFYIRNNQDGSAIASSDISASKELVEHYIVALETRTYLEEVIRRAEVDVSCGELKNMLSCGAVGSTSMLRVTVTSSAAEESWAIASAIGEILPEKITPVMAGSSAQVIEPPVVAEEANSTGLLKNTVLGFFAGLCVSAIAVMILEIKRRA